VATVLDSTQCVVLFTRKRTSTQVEPKKNNNVCAILAICLFVLTLVLRKACI
jgi:hypothetical protein